MNPSLSRRPGSSGGRDLGADAATLARSRQVVASVRSVGGWRARGCGRAQAVSTAWGAMKGSALRQAARRAWRQAARQPVGSHGKGSKEGLNDHATAPGPPAHRPKPCSKANCPSTVARRSRCPWYLRDSCLARWAPAAFAPSVGVVALAFRIAAPLSSVGSNDKPVRDLSVHGRLRLRWRPVVHCVNRAGRALLGCRSRC